MAGNLARWPQATWWRPAVRLAAVLAPLLTAAILSTVRDSVTAATSVLVLVVWVVAAAATGDRPAGVLAAVSAGAWFDFFLTEPYLRFTIADTDDIEETVLLVVISLAVSEVALWGYRQQKQAAQRSGYLDGVLGAARAVAEGNNPQPAWSTSWPVRSMTCSPRTTADTSRDRCVTLDAVLDHDGVLKRNGRCSRCRWVGLPTDEYVAVPVRRGGNRRPLPAHHDLAPGLPDPRTAPGRRPPGGSGAAAR